MYKTTRQGRRSDAARVNELRNKLKAEGRGHERVVVVDDRIRRQLQQRSLPYQRGELTQWGASMEQLLLILVWKDAAEVIREHALKWLRMREQAADFIAKCMLPWLYQPGGPMLRRDLRALDFVETSGGS